MIIHFVRHCESIWNQDSRYSGHTNVPLSINGIQQAKKLAKKIKISSDYNNGLEFFETNTNYNINNY